MLRKMPVLPAILGTAILLLSGNSAMADGNLNKVKHVIIVMQENHSFDNYFGALAYAPASPYHNGNGASRGHRSQMRRRPDVHGYKGCVPLHQLQPG